MSIGGESNSGALNTLLCVSVPSFMINLDSNIVAVSLPSISQSLHADFTAIEWVISAYTLAFASLVLPAGSLADRYGRKRMLILGLSIFSIASFFCGAAPNVLVLDVARVFQGVGAALQLSSALAILSHRFHGPARAKAFAFWGSVVGIAIALGPVAGGLITQYFGWQWAFYVNIPIGVAMIALTLATIDESKDPNATRLDIPGLLTFSSALFLTTLALIQGNHLGWTNPLIVGAFVGAAAIFAMFILVESKQVRPMLDLSFFRDPTYVGANIAGLSFAACLLTMLTFLPIYFQGGLNHPAAEAGLMMLPLAVPLFIVPRIVASHLAPRFSGRALLTAGLAILSIGLYAMAVAAPYFRYEAMLFGMVMAGIGAGVLNGEVAKVGISVIPPERAGMASGMSGTMRFSGIVVGFAALGAILVGRVSSIIEADPSSPTIGDISTLVRDVAAGNLRAGLLGTEGLYELLMRSFGGGYRMILTVAATAALAASFSCWLLIRSKVAAAAGNVIPLRARAPGDRETSSAA